MKRVLLCLGCGLLSLALALGLAACGGGQTAVPTASPSQPRETPAPAETPEPAVYDDSLIADAYADAGEPATEWDGTYHYKVRVPVLLCGCSGGKAAAPRTPSVPETAALLEVSWTRTTSSADGSFWFTAGRPQWEPDAEGHFLNCEYRAENGETVERRDAPIPDAQWAELEKLVRSLNLAPYEAPDEHLLDAPDSEVTVTWTDGGEKLRCRYAAGGADALDAFLRELAYRTQPASERR